MKQSQLAEAREWARATTLTPREAERAGIAINQDGRRRSVIDLLALPSVSRETLAPIWPRLGDMTPSVAEQLEIEALYAGYLDRQEADILAFKKDESLKLSINLPYEQIKGLSNEVRQKLIEAQPTTLGQAGRIEGVTPAALAVVLAWVEKKRRGRGGGLTGGCSDPGRIRRRRRCFTGNARSPEGV